MPFIRKADYEAMRNDMVACKRERDQWRARADQARSALFAKLRPMVEAVAPGAVFIHFDEPGTRTRAVGAQKAVVEESISQVERDVKPQPDRLGTAEESSKK